MVALGLGLLIAAADAPRAPMKPIAPWVVSFQEESCLVSRIYGSKARPITLGLRPSPFRGASRLIVVEPGRGPNVGRQYRATVQLNQAEPIPTNMLSFGVKDSRAISVAIPTFSPQAQVTTIRVKGQWADHSFETPGLSAAIAKMDECLTDLQRFWNADPARAERIAAPPEPVKPLANLFTPATYPADAMREAMSGRVRFTLLVDEQGAVRDCSTFQSSGVASLDTMSCYVITENARFRPARGPDGRPVKGVYCQTILWALNAGDERRLKRDAERSSPWAEPETETCGVADKAL